MNVAMRYAVPIVGVNALFSHAIGTLPASVFSFVSIASRISLLLIRHFLDDARELRDRLAHHAAHCLIGKPCLRLTFSALRRQRVESVFQYSNVGQGVG